MEIKGKEIRINDIVILTEAYDGERHFFPLDRKLVGWVSMLKEWGDIKYIAIKELKLINAKEHLSTLNKEKSVLRIITLLPKIIGLNFLLKDRYYLEEKDIKNIEVLKKWKKT